MCENLDQFALRNPLLECSIVFSITASHNGPYKDLPSHWRTTAPRNRDLEHRTFIVQNNLGCSQDIRVHSHRKLLKCLLKDVHARAGRFYESYSSYIALPNVGAMSMYPRCANAKMQSTHHYSLNSRVLLLIGSCWVILGKGIALVIPRLAR